MATTQISHDAFARFTIERRLVETTQDCAYCGQPRRGGSKLFQYGTEPDGISTKINWHKGLFCSKPCHDIYHLH